jgi:hypothetical protein
LQNEVDDTHKNRFGVSADEIWRQKRNACIVLFFILLLLVAAGFYAVQEGRRCYAEMQAKGQSELEKTADVGEAAGFAAERERDAAVEPVVEQHPKPTPEPKQKPVVEQDVPRGKKPAVEQHTLAPKQNPRPTPEAEPVESKEISPESKKPAASQE